MAKRPIGGIQIVRDPTRTYSDEWQVRDTVLSPSEVRTVRDAADKLGVRLGHTPTGRYAELLLKHCMELALNNSAAMSAQGRRAMANMWYAVYLRAKNAISQVERKN